MIIRKAFRQAICIAPSTTIKKKNKKNKIINKLKKKKKKKQKKTASKLIKTATCHGPLIYLRTTLSSIAFICLRI